MNKTTVQSLLREAGHVASALSNENGPFEAYDVTPPIDEGELVGIFERHFGLPAARAGAFLRFGRTSVRTEVTDSDQPLVHYFAVADGDGVEALYRKKEAGSS